LWNTSISICIAVTGRIYPLILVEGLHVKWLMVGEDFCSAHAAGNTDTLKEAGQRYGFEVSVLPAVKNGDIRISSSAVRAALAAGDFSHASDLLGHSYRISGHVVHGQNWAARSASRP
jgi:riboflavin kinase/FMN adenylyltransferase